MRSATFDELCREGVLEIGDGYRAKNSELGGDGPIFLRSAYLQDHGFVRDMPERFKVAKAAQFGSKASRLGDVVITTKGNSTGRIGVIREDQVGAIYSPHLSYWRSLDAEKLDQRFLGYWAQTEEFKSQLGGMAYSTDMAPYLSLRDQRRLRISLPEISIQCAAAELLQALDDKIELNRRMSETLAAMAQAIFRDWFVDFGPSRRKLDGATDPVTIMGRIVQDVVRAQALSNLFPATLDNDGLPEGWVERAFSTLVDIIGGGTPKTSIERYWSGPIPWFSVTDTPPKGSVFVDVTEKTISMEGLENSSARLVRAGTTIISARGTVGNLALAAHDMTFNQSCYGLQGKGAVGDCFVFLAAQNVVERLKGMAHGSVFSTITRATFDGVGLVRSSNATFEAFEQIVGPMFDKISSNVKENRALAATRDLLLPKFMSGEIRLSDAADVIEASQ